MSHKTTIAKSLTEPELIRNPYPGTYTGKNLQPCSPPRLLSPDHSPDHTILKLPSKEEASRLTETGVLL